MNNRHAARTPGGRGPFAPSATDVGAPVLYRLGGAWMSRISQWDKRCHEKLPPERVRFRWRSGLNRGA